MISNNLIFDNQADFSGGGMHLFESTLWILNNVISNNTTEKRGGAIYSYYSSVLTITNNTMVRNSAQQNGGGIFCNYFSTSTVTNTILWDNSAPKGKEITVETVSTVNIAHSDVDGGFSSVYMDSSCTLNWGPSMINFDPNFVDPHNRDFHITYLSPCRDYGDLSAPGLPETDFEGDPRNSFAGVDLGADEFNTHLYYTGDAIPGGEVEAKFIGQPSSMPVGLWFGSGVLDPPIPSTFGNWYLQYPWLGPIILDTIPYPKGILVISATIPTTPTGPYSLPMQALIGDELSNLCILQVE